MRSISWKLTLAYYAVASMAAQRRFVTTTSWKLIFFMKRCCNKTRQVIISFFRSKVTWLKPNKRKRAFFLLPWREILAALVVPGNTKRRGRLSTIDLLIKKDYNNIVSSSWSKLVRTWKSTVLRLPIRQGFPGCTIFMQPQNCVTFVKMSAIPSQWLHYPTCLGYLGLYDTKRL